MSILARPLSQPRSNARTSAKKTPDSESSATRARTCASVIKPSTGGSPTISSAAAAAAAFATWFIDELLIDREYTGVRCGSASSRGVSSRSRFFASGLDVMPTNPWLEIPLADYEAHMELPQVAQAELLAEQLAAAVRARSPDSVAVLGCAGGNGLDRLPAALRVVGVDVN